MSLCADLEDLCTCFYLLYSFVLIKVIIVEIRFAVLHVLTLFGYIPFNWFCLDIYHLTGFAWIYTI